MTRTLDLKKLEHLLAIYNSYVSGNAHLVYAIIRKRNVFHQLANLPTDPTGIKRPGKHGENNRDSDSSSLEDGLVIEVESTVTYCLSTCTPSGLIRQK